MESSIIETTYDQHPKWSFALLGWYQFVCLFLWVFNIYSEVPFLLPGNKSLPSFLLVFLIPAIWPFFKNSLRVKHFFFPIGVTAVAVFSILVYMDSKLFVSSIFKLIQFFYSLLLCLLTYFFIVNINSVRLRKFLFLFSISIVVGCLLERIGILDDITAAYRSVYKGTNYGGDIDLDREVFISGFVRPYFFTSEPSLVGLGFFACSTTWALLNKVAWLDIFMCIMGFILLILLGSPSVILSPILIFLIAIIKYKLPILRIVLLLTSVVLLLLLGYNTGMLLSFLEPLIFRFSSELLQEGTSMYVRIYVPYQVTLPKIVETYPFWGVGYGNHGMINVLFGFSYQMEEDETLFLRGSNAFINFFTYMGILGSTLIFWMLYRFHLQNAVRYFMLTFIFLFFAGQITGTFATPRYWCFIALFMGASYSAFKPEKNNAN